MKKWMEIGELKVINTDESGMKVLKKWWGPHYNVSMQSREDEWNN